jgi:hypothetical protein
LANLSQIWPSFTLYVPRATLDWYNDSYPTAGWTYQIAAYD